MSCNTSTTSRKEYGYVVGYNQNQKPGESKNKTAFSSAIYWKIYTPRSALF